MIFTTLITLFAGLTSAHMAMIDPCTNFTPNGPNCPALPAGASYDYNLKTPIGTKDAIAYPLCKNPGRRPTPVATWNAGDTVTASFESGGAAHGGGHCQFSLSYDNGNSFVVVHEELSYCFFSGPSDTNDATVLKYDFVLPSSVPASDNVIFAWSWVNAIGNREFYMNCADIKINSQSSSYSGKKMVIANYGPSNPVVAEFNGDYTTGLDLYNNSPVITVYGNGVTTNNANYQDSSVAPPVVIVSSSIEAPPAAVAYSSVVAPVDPVQYSDSAAAAVVPTYAPSYAQTYSSSQDDSYGNNKQGELQISQANASADAIAPTPSAEYTGYTSSGNVAEPSVNNDLGNGYASQAQAQAVASPGVSQSSDSPSGSCTSGNMMCGPSGNGDFFVCDHSAWVKFSLPEGVICKSDGTSVSFSTA
ncbi:hypothetical protein AYI68_g6354 [Smittium mucronatum]|uniref:Carbohydrate-binding module family 19 domain-containing protein n=1 Tax=Smittium mucronatum TaxID=133383 RepID=A0A1R0GRP1_9FUNG|nr:hypothetical protein AYI68_g6354 [Smittium mucronatum]